MNLPPLNATLMSSTCIFAVQCEATQRWISSLNNPHRVIKDPQRKAEMKETLKKVEYQFHKVEETAETLTVIEPVGYWLKDGRLVSRSYKEEEPIKGYFGKEVEVRSMNRKIEYIRANDECFIPSDF